MRKRTYFPNFLILQIVFLYNDYVDFPGGPKVKNMPGNAGYTVSSPGPGRFLMPQGN